MLKDIVLVLLGVAVGSCVVRCQGENNHPHEKTPPKHALGCEDVGKYVRCENDEVTCYSDYQTGMQCFFKELP